MDTYASEEPAPARPLKLGLNRNVPTTRLGGSRHRKRRWPTAGVRGSWKTGRYPASSRYQSCCAWQASMTGRGPHVRM